MSLIPFGRSSKIGVPGDLISHPRLTASIIKIIFGGWAEALTRNPPPMPTHDEEGMNGALAQGMRASVQALMLTNIEVFETPGERSDPTLEAPDVEPDVILIVAQFAHRLLLRAVVECKRLDPMQSPQRSLRRDYVRKGMDRFISERYGRGRQLCFMVGYVLRQNGAAAMDDINMHLQAVGRTADRLAVAPRFHHVGFVGESAHKRPGNGPHLTLLHSFLIFPAGISDLSGHQIASGG